MKVTVTQSIEQNITLIITTKLGEYAFDNSFGCRIWEKDFMVPSNMNTWKDEIKESLEEAIKKHEHRIDEMTRFEVRVNEAAIGPKRINQRLDIIIGGSIKGTNEKFDYEETLYFSPYSLY